MFEIRDKKIESLYINSAAKFLEKNSASRDYMITVTGAKVENQGKEVTILFTVFPEKYEERGLKFARSLRSEFRNLIKAGSRTKIIPTFDFAIDLGEKHRQAIDSLVQNTK